MPNADQQELSEVRVEPGGLEGLLGIPAGASGIVLFAHGSGSGRFSPRNNYVAAALRRAGLATFLLDLLTPDQEHDRRNVFDIDLLAGHLKLATRWIARHPATTGLPIAYFGASTGAAAALAAAADEDDPIAAIVSRGGRPDLAGRALARVRAPTLLVVGGADEVVLDLNRAAFAVMRCGKQLVVIPGATHLFEEPGALDAVIDHAKLWFLRHFSETSP